MTFVKGQSGNPAGRPLGSRNRATLAAEEKFEAFAAELMEKLLELVRKGDRAAMRLCFDHFVPRGRERPVWFAMPKLACAADAPVVAAATFAAMQRGEISPAEALDVLRVIDEVVKLLAKADAMEAGERAARPASAEANGGVVETSDLQAERPCPDRAADLPPGGETSRPACAAAVETSKIQAARPGGDHAERPANGTMEPAREFAETSRIQARTPAASASPGSGPPAGGRAQAEPGNAATANTSGIQARPGDHRPWPGGEGDPEWSGAPGAPRADTTEIQAWPKNPPPWPDGSPDTWWSFAPAVPPGAIADTSRLQAHRPPGGAGQASQWEEPGLLGNAMLAPVLAALERQSAGR